MHHSAQFTIHDSDQLSLPTHISIYFYTNKFWIDILSFQKHYPQKGGRQMLVDTQSSSKKLIQFPWVFIVSTHPNTYLLADDIYSAAFT